MHQLSAYGMSLDPDYQSSKEISIGGEFLFSVLSRILDQVPIDDEWYRNNNADFYAAELKEFFTGPRDHYVRYGFLENRMPHPIKVDPDFYASMYPDIAQRFKEGSIDSLQDHFDRYGYREGRIPYENWSLFKAKSTD